MDVEFADLSDQPRNVISRHVLQICHSALPKSKGNCSYIFHIHVFTNYISLFQ